MKTGAVIGKWMWAAALLLWHIAGLAQVVRVGPEMDHATVMEGLNAAKAGDTILFTEGTYPGNYLLENLHGMVNRPVVIRGEVAGTTLIDGESKPGMSLKNNAFKLKDCSWISMENFTIQNCCSGSWW
jgi:hypothetical protein